MSVNKIALDQYIKTRGNYTMVPNELWELNELDVYDKTIWAYIFSRKPGWKSSRNNIVRNLKIDKERVSKSINALIKYNLLNISKGRNNALSFELITPDKWAVAQPISSLPHSSNVSGEAAYTKEYNNKSTKNIFSQEGNIYEASKGATSDLRKQGNMHLPEKINIDPNFSIDSPEADVIFRDLEDRGVTPADLNGMSLIEYANMRAYADSFKTVDTTELVRQWNEQNDELSLEDMIKVTVQE